MKAIELVQKAVDLGGRLSSARSRGLLRGDAIFIRVVRATTHLTERIAAQPPPKEPSPNERTALTLAAAQLRFLGHTLTPDGVIDPGTPEGALAELVVSTLALVDTMLGDTRELDARDDRRGTLALGVGDRRGDGDPNRNDGDAKENTPP